MSNSSKSKSTYVKGLHNRAAHARNYVTPPERKTPKGFKRGSEVMFDPALDPTPSVFFDTWTSNKMYIVISVFQPKVTSSKTCEVTLRDENGDCYGYVPEHFLVAWDTSNVLTQKVEAKTWPWPKPEAKPVAKVKNSIDFDHLPEIVAYVDQKVVEEQMEQGAVLRMYKQLGQADAVYYLCRIPKTPSTKLQILGFLHESTMRALFAGNGSGPLQLNQTFIKRPGYKAVSILYHGDITQPHVKLMEVQLADITNAQELDNCRADRAIFDYLLETTFIE